MKSIIQILKGNCTNSWWVAAFSFVMYIYYPFWQALLETFVLRKGHLSWLLAYVWPQLEKAAAGREWKTRKRISCSAWQNTGVSLKWLVQGIDVSIFTSSSNYSSIMIFALVLEYKNFIQASTTDRILYSKTLLQNFAPAKVSVLENTVFLFCFFFNHSDCGSFLKSKFLY